MRYRSARKRCVSRFHLGSPEQLEGRRLLATFTVVNTENSGAGSLRQALIDANGATNPIGDVDHIVFDIPGTGVQTIRVSSAPLPEITDPVSIDGYTQSDAAANTNPVTEADNAVLLVELDGSAIQDSASGLTISAGDSTVRGLVIDGFSRYGLELTGNGGNHIAGNFIGTNAAGTDAKANSNGVLVGSPENIIGGTATADRNLISGNNGLGIYLSRVTSGTDGGARTLIQGNFVGTDKSGTTAVPNHNHGILISIGADTTVGGTALAARNLISGNIGKGISANSVRALIQGNLIGTDISGAVGLGNGAAGVDTTFGVDNSIGGAVSGAGNIISSNSLGIDMGQGSTGTVIQGNFIGTDATATLNMGNRVTGILALSTSGAIGGSDPGAGNVIAFSYAGNGTGIEYFATGIPVLHNSIFGNLGEGILFSPGIAPKLTSATQTTIEGSLTGGTANAAYHLEFFATPDTGNRTDNIQGKTFLGELDVTTDGSGAVNYSISPTGGLPGGQFLTATATAPDGTTSNFSAAIKISATVAADVGVTVSAAPDSVAPGGMVTYTITVSNVGPNDASSVRLLNDIPAGTTFASLSAPSGWTLLTPDVGGTGTISASLPETLISGANAIFTLVVRVDSAAADNSIIAESTTVSSETSDPNTDNQSDSTTTNVHAQAPAPAADLAVTQSASPPNAKIGTDDVTFTVSVTNNGPSPASHVTLTETLPAGAAFLSASGGITPTDGTLTFVAGDLASGESVTYTILVRPQSAGTMTLSGSVSAAEADPFLANNKALASAVAVNATTTVPPGPVVTPSPAPASDNARLIRVQRFGIHTMPTTVVLSFDKPLEPAARRLRNFRITGPKGTRISIRSAVYDPTAHTITLHPSERLSIHHPYKLNVSGTGCAPGAMLPLGHSSARSRLSREATTRSGSPGGNWFCRHGFARRMRRPEPWPDQQAVARPHRGLRVPAQAQPAQRADRQSGDGCPAGAMVSHRECRARIVAALPVHRAVWFATIHQRVPR